MQKEDNCKIRQNKLRLCLLHGMGRETTFHIYSYFFLKIYLTVPIIVFGCIYRSKVEMIIYFILMFDNNGLEMGFEK